MTQTLGATFDGVVFRPDQPVKIKPNTHVQIVVKTDDTANKTVADLAGHLFGVIEAPIDQKNASAWEDWAKSHTQNTVIIDDSREAIYED
jgi:predicted DNA-binding antitoxin AbrB/MazE fold protein